MLELDIQFFREGFALEAACALDRPVTALYGPSGAGKTTLLHLIAGLERASAGRIQLNGTVFFDRARRVWVPPHRRCVGTVFQDGRLFPHRSVEGNLRYGERLVEAGRRRVRFGDVVELLAMGGMLKRCVDQLSGGERQRVALGRALLMSPRLLLLDEPLASLDTGMKRQVLPFLRRVRDAADVPIVYVSHDLVEVLQLTEELVVLDAGRVVRQGRFRHVVDDPHVFALTRQLGLENVIPLRVRGHMAAEGLTQYEVIAAEDSGRAQGAGPAVLLGPRVDRPRGSALYAAIRPEDVALSVEAITGISIQNQLPGEVTRITDHEGKVLAEIDVGRAILAEVSLKSVHELQLAAGRGVHCLIKAQAIRVLD